jgi:hypothetical protein
MSDLIRKQQSLDECTSDGKAKYLLTCGGNITCLRCTAKSTRTKQQCGRPAITTSRTQKCQFHGGRNSGPKSATGKRQIAQAQTKHGAYSKANLQAKHAEAVQLRQLEDVGFLIGLLRGSRTRGPKPSGYVPVKSITALRLLIKST